MRCRHAWRAQRVNPRLNALVTIDGGCGAGRRGERARWHTGRPLGPLDGVPVTIKDNMHVRGCTQTGAAERSPGGAERDELPVARLRKAGALIFGKTNAPEFTMQGYTDNPVYGATGNPWNPALTPGGSSGGAAALVASGGCPVALGTDGGGSIRRPAAHTNLVGYKPSRGRVPRADGLPKIFLDYEVVGPLTRCVDDAVSALKVLGAPDARDASSLVSRRRSTWRHARPFRVLYVPRFAHHPVDPASRRARRGGEQPRGAGTSVETAAQFDAAEAVNARWPMLSQVGAGVAGRAAQRAAGLGSRSRPRSSVPRCRPTPRRGRRPPARALFELLYEVERLRPRCRNCSTATTSC